ncbi:MAG TPA: dockerin type I domain-containing protein, partial [Phycisphaerae bacterium]|nr:dockerin type I domain-containing protein [Phycisphaerae bacterium]
IWMVVNNATDKYDIYMNTGTSPATAANKLASQLSFRNGTTQDLDTFLAYGGAAPVANGVRVDDIVFQAGTDLTNPTAGFNANLAWSPETLSVAGDYTQNAGATLQLNLGSTSAFDKLHVTGKATLAGTLNITYALGAAAPKIGDVFDLLDAGTFAGNFASLQLPGLTGTLAWDSSLLNFLGTLAIFSNLAGDYNQDGKVDAADLPVAQGALANLPAFQAAHGYSSFTLLGFGDVNHDSQVTHADVQALQSIVGVPEPGTVLMVGAGLLGLLRRPRKETGIQAGRK